MKIAMVAACRCPSNEGAYARSCGLAQALARRGHEVHLLISFAGNTTPPDGVLMHHALSFGGNQPTPSSFMTRLFLLTPLMAMRLWLVVRKRRIDVIYADRPEGIVIALAGRGLRQVRLVYDVQPPAIRPARHFHRTLAKVCDRLIAESETLKEALVRQGIPARRIDVVQTGVDPASFGAGNAAEAAEKYGLKTKKIVLYDAGIVSHQAATMIREIVRMVLAKEPETVFFVMGEEDESEPAPLQTEEDIKDNMIVSTGRSLGETANLAAAARVAVVAAPESSHARRNLLYYMGGGMAIVSLGGPTDLIAQGESGLIAENGDALGAADAIVSLLRDEELAQRLGERGRNSLAGKHEWPSIAEKTEGLFMQLVSRPRQKQAKTAD